MSRGGTQSDYARYAGVSKQAVSKAVQAERITVDEHGNVPDFEQADREWAENTDLTKPANRVTGNPKGSAAKRGPSPTLGIAKSQARRARAQASLEELKLEQMRGDLLSRADVEREIFENHRRARDRVRMIDARLGPMLSPEAREALRKEIRDVCADLGGEASE